MGFDMRPGSTRAAAIQTILRRLPAEERDNPAVYYALHWMTTVELNALVAGQGSAREFFQRLQHEFTCVVAPAVGLERAVAPLLHRRDDDQGSGEVDLPR